MTRLNLAKTALALLTALTTSLAAALPSDRNQPIHISSETAEIDDINGRSIYRGQVDITQGSIELDADEVIIHSDEAGITKVIAIGNPAHFRQLPEPGDALLHAYGETIEYYVSEERLELIKAAKLEQAQNTFTGERIDYDIKRRVVNAFSGSDQQSAGETRVNMVIQPNKLNPPAEEDTSANE